MGNDQWKDQPKKMSEQTVQAVAGELAKLARAQERAFSVVFHGGEPLLVGADRFESMCQILRRALPDECSLHLQTNGVLLSDKILQTCAAHDVGISISLDGPAEVHDAARLDHRGSGSHERVLAGIRKLSSQPQAAALFTGVLAVVDVASDPIEIYEFLKSTKAPSIDFLYRDGNHDVLPIGKVACLSTEYGEWMVRLVDYYLDDQSPTPIRFLDDIIRLLIGGAARKEGVGVSDYGILVFETDGTIAKNDTLKSASPFADRFEVSRSVFDCNLTSFVCSNEFSEYHQSQRPTSSICKTCRYLEVCGGGMPPHRYSKANGIDNPTIFCADQKYLIEHLMQYLSRRMAVAA